MSEDTNEVMSGEELRLHLVRLLYSGADGWNNWRKENRHINLDFSKQRFEGMLSANLYDVDFSDATFTEARFHSANLRRANFKNSDLSGANLDGADLHEASFSGANLICTNLGGSRGANLSGVSSLSGANLTRAEVSGDLTGMDLTICKCEGTKFIDVKLNRANAGSAIFKNSIFNKVMLIGANIMGADFSSAEFSDVDFTDATVGLTIFANNDLSNVRGLETLSHRMPSTIGIDTIYRSKGNIPEIFLRGCGVPEEFITYMHSLTAHPIKFYSCFISYSSKNQLFADRLHADLQTKGVRCWFAPEDMKIGDRFRVKIDESIRVYDKLLLVLSENSVASSWVEKEVETAMEREQEDSQHRTVLFPVRLDDAVMEIKTGWPADVRRTRHIGDFTHWKDHDSYQKAFNRLLRDLKASE